MTTKKFNHEDYPEWMPISLAAKAVGLTRRSLNRALEVSHKPKSRYAPIKTKMIKGVRFVEMYSVCEYMNAPKCRMTASEAMRYWERKAKRRS